MRYAPDSPIHFPYNISQTPDILDITSINLPRKMYNITNFNDLSSDYNSIGIETEKFQNSNFLPKTKTKIN